MSLLPDGWRRPARWLATGLLLLLVHFVSSTLRGGGEGAKLVGRCVVFVSATVTMCFLQWARRQEQVGMSPKEARSQREKYQLSERGFLPAGCLDRLPARWDAWEAVIDELPQLNRSRRLKCAVDALPLIAAEGLESLPELRRASWVLGALACSYLNGDFVPWEKIEDAEAEPVDVTGAPGDRVLPACVAVPWLHVCGKLGLPPVLTASAVDLWNWQPNQEFRSTIDTAAEFVPANLECISTMTATKAEVMFHMLPCSMQNAAGPLILRTFQADALIRDRHDRELVQLLEDLSKLFVRFRELFASVHNLVDKRIFYDIYRPLMSVQAQMLLSVSPLAHCGCYRCCCLPSCWAPLAGAGFTLMALF